MYLYYVEPVKPFLMCIPTSFRSKDEECGGENAALPFSLVNNSGYVPFGGLQTCEFRSNTSHQTAQLPASTRSPNDSMPNYSLDSKIPFLTDYEKGPYEQFILFGDSVTQMSCAQDLGFAWTPALQNGEPSLSSFTWAFALEYRVSS